MEWPWASGPRNTSCGSWGRQATKGEKQSTGGDQQDPAAVREMQIILWFVPALNNCSESLLFVCLTYTDPCSVAAERTAQNKLSPGEELTESTGHETSVLKSRNFKFLCRFGSCKVPDWSIRKEELSLEKSKTHTQTCHESHALLFPHQVIINLFVDSLGEGVIG